jgi:nucleotide sugar dehydrogenase
MKKLKVCVIGLGQIGYPVAHYAHAIGLEVWGYDLNPVIVERVKASKNFGATCFWKEIPNDIDVYLICVTTGQKQDLPDLSAVWDVSKKISEKSISSSLVSIESTIVPGTCKRIFEETFGRRNRLVHVPHRYWVDEPEKHGVNQLRVIGGVDPESLGAGLEFYRDVLGIPLYVCPSIEVAEMCKIIENSHRYLQIAFAEDLKMMCQRIGMNFEDLKAACNTKWNVDIPEAKDGIGRHCLPKDIRYVTSLTPSILLSSSIKADQEYREWLSKQKLS